MIRWATNILVSRSVANKHTRARLDKLREECFIPCGKEMNELVKEVVGRGVSYMLLSEDECRKVITFMKRNQASLSDKYRGLRWK
jgi:hypothetical protein